MIVISPEKLIQAVCLFLIPVLLVSSPVSAGSADPGVSAYLAKKYKESFELLSPAAEAGNPEAQNYLGLMLAGGKGQARNDKRAAYWFRRAARSGHNGARKNLEFLIANGRARGNVGDPEEDGCD